MDQFNETIKQPCGASLRADAQRVVDIVLHEVIVTHTFSRAAAGQARVLHPSGWWDLCAEDPGHPPGVPLRRAAAPPVTERPTPVDVEVAPPLDAQVRDGQVMNCR